MYLGAVVAISIFRQERVIILQQKPSSALIIAEEEGARELHKLQLFLGSSDHDSRPAEIDQLPVMPRLQVDGDVGAEMGFPAAATDGIRQARNAILLSLRVARATGKEGIHYSRNSNTYTRLAHNTPAFWTYTNVRRAVDTLLQRSDLVSEDRARPQNPYAPNFTPRRSVLFAGPSFVDAVVGTTDAIVEAAKNERIILRDRRKRPLLVPPGPIVDETMRFLAQFDDAVAPLDFEFSDSAIRWQSSTLAIAIDDGWRVLINTDRRFLTRIFTGSMFDGARFYRVFWQEITKPMRRSLLIDGAPIAEPDYSACHLRLAHFVVGERLPVLGAAGPDHYTLDGFGPEWRTVIKKGVSILLNARTYTGAVGAIASIDEMPKGSWDQRVEMAVTIVSSIMQRHEALAPLGHSGCGLGLQYVDSQLTIACATELIGRGIVPLPIHDSMLVRSEHLSDLKEVMERRFDEDGRRLATERFKVIAKRNGLGFRGHDLTQGQTTASVLRARPRRDVGTAPSVGSSVCLVSAPSSPVSSRYTGSAPSDGSNLDLTRLRRNPIIIDLELVIAHRKWVSDGLVRGALLSAMPLVPRARGGCARRPRLIDLIVSETSATMDKARVEAEFTRFIRRAQRTTSARLIARISGITAKIAADLDLTVVVPLPRKPSLSRRAKRMGKVLPRIISIKAAAPWIDPRKRASWYAQHPDPADRQVLALNTLLASGNTSAITAARAAIERAMRERASLARQERLPVDRLLAHLQLRLMVHDMDPTSSPRCMSDCAFDIAYQHGENRATAQCKTVTGTATDVRAHLKAVLLGLNEMLGRPIHILTL